jgi:hypothetical protein
MRDLSVVVSPHAVETVLGEARYLVIRTSLGPTWEVWIGEWCFRIPVRQNGETILPDRLERAICQYAAVRAEELKRRA